MEARPAIRAWYRVSRGNLGLIDMDLSAIATQLFIDKLGGTRGEIKPDKVSSALDALLGDGRGNIDLGSIISKLDGEGFTKLAQTWLGDGVNDGISTEQIRILFGGSSLGDFASRLDLPPATAMHGLTGMLPELVDRNSKGGSLLGGIGDDELPGTASPLLK